VRPRAGTCFCKCRDCDNALRPTGWCHRCAPERPDLLPHGWLLLAAAGISQRAATACVDPRLQIPRDMPATGEVPGVANTPTAAPGRPLASKGAAELLLSRIPPATHPWPFAACGRGRGAPNRPDRKCSAAVAVATAVPVECGLNTRPQKQLLRCMQCNTLRLCFRVCDGLLGH